MGIPAISVIVPALNEESCIGEFLTRVAHCLDSACMTWEIIVVDDGSSDRTARIVDDREKHDARVRLLRQPHGGKGSAIRRGMLSARGGWRLMADADLSVSPENWKPLLEALRRPRPADLIIGSREAPGSRRIGEPLRRHIIGRVFNRLVRLVAVRGIDDTQCGFKVFSEAAVQMLFPHLTFGGFVFDVELLFLAQRAGLAIEEVGLIWECRRDSRVRLRDGASAFADIMRIRWRYWRGSYSRLKAVGYGAASEISGSGS